MISAQRIVLTKDQQLCVEYDESPHFLIAGVAGSGKTSILLRRACRLAQSGERVVVFTYNKTLATYARELVDLNVGPGNVEVTNFHRWAWHRLSPSLTRRRPVPDWERANLISQVLERQAPALAASPALRAKSPAWWGDEFRWIKQRGVLDFAAYQQVERKGRDDHGLRRDTERPTVWRVFEEFEAVLAASGRYEFDDFGRALLAMGALLRDREAIDHVLVDELQDLGTADLIVLRHLALKSLTLVEDRGQKLYRRSYDLVDADIEVTAVPVPGRGLLFRSKRLSVSYRSTREIAALVADLRRHDTSLSDEDRLSQLPPDPSGHKPVIFAARDASAEEEIALRWVTALAARHPRQTIALVARQWDVLDRLRQRLPPALPHEVIRDHEGSPSSPGVKLISAHSCKGLEFDAVVLLHANEGVIPVDLPDPGPAATAEERAEFEKQRADHINAERRLLYVPMSRARSQLYVLYAEGLRSRFLDELDPQLYDNAPPTDL